MNPVDHPMGGGEGRIVGRSSPLHAVGQADQGLQDPEARENRCAHLIEDAQEESVSRS